MSHISRWHFQLALASAIILACVASCTTPPKASGEDLARMIAEAWTSHDLEIVDEVFADQGVYEDLTAGTKRQGREAIKVGFSETREAVPDFKVSLTKVFSSNGMVACEWVMSGTHTGDYPGLPATGKSFSVRGASIGRVRDGQIVRWTDYYDGFTFLQQLGVASFSPPVQGQ